MASGKRGIGRGLAAILPEAEESAAGELRELPVGLIKPNPSQPRTNFDPEALAALADSIEASGVVQPLLVRPLPDGSYELVAGERRWRAAQRAGLTRVPVVIKEVAAGSDAQLLEMALIENIQREDLNPIDQAAAYEKLSTDFGMTQEEIAAAVGKDRSSVANHMRLLKLPQEVRAEVAGGRLSMGHARALLAITDEGAQRQVAREVIARNLSVRETEAMVKRVGQETASVQRSAALDSVQGRPATDVHTRAAEDKLRMALGTRVRINRKGKGGRIEIDFGSEDELQRLYQHLTS